MVLPAASAEDAIYSSVATWSRRVHRILNRIVSTSGVACRSHAFWQTLKKAFDLDVILKHDFDQLRKLNSVNGTLKHDPDRDCSSSIAAVRSVVNNLAVYDAASGPFPLWDGEKAKIALGGDI